MISFICSAYNRPNNLKLLAYSLICQDNPDWELLVMDESEERINDISSLDTRIKYVPCERFNDFGYSVKNLGIPHATGQFLAFPADDVYYAPPFVRLMTTALENNDLVYCNWILDKRNYSLVQVAPVIGSIDVGGFVVRKSIIGDGFTDKGGLGDGLLIQKLAQSCRHTALEQILYVKN
jgi:glycosyltransferase involved in cell wall biosynthesis